MSTLCDLCFMMSEVCALGEIFVKLLFSSLLLYTFHHVVRNYNLETSALIFSHPSLELGLKVSEPKGNLTAQC